MHLTSFLQQVFRDKLQQIPSLQESGHRELEIIFSNITEIYDFSVNLLGSLEDTMEVTEENESPAIGICFEELAEVHLGLGIDHRLINERDTSILFMTLHMICFKLVLLI